MDCLALRVIPLEVRRRIKLTGAELEEYRQKEKVPALAKTKSLGNIPPSHAPLPHLGKGSARTRSPLEGDKNTLGSMTTNPVVDHVPKSSETIPVSHNLMSLNKTSFSYPFPTQEKEKKNVSSLVEAALDEESDSEDEMEVSFTKVCCQLPITDQPL